MREERDEQQPIYDVSNTFKNAELRYSQIEKVGFTLLLAARRLRPYFHAHTVKVMTNFPLEKYLKKLEKSGRTLNWVVELGEFDIKFALRTALKGQSLVDFVVECSIPPSSED